jgi:hypothetical protein
MGDCSRISPDGENAGGVNEVAVEGVVKSTQRANTRREGRRLPVSSQPASIALPRCWKNGNDNSFG